MQQSCHLPQNKFYFWNYLSNFRNLPNFQVMHLKNKAISYCHWKYQWSLKYMLAPAHLMRPPFSHLVPPPKMHRSTKSCWGLLRKFFACNVFYKNSPQPAFFLTSNTAGFNFSAPAAVWIRWEGASFEAWPCRGCFTGCQELQHTKHQHHRTTGTKPSRPITENILPVEPVLGTSLSSEGILTHAVR